MLGLIDWENGGETEGKRFGHVETREGDRWGELVVNDIFGS
jgi:hypothetical protein